MYLSFALRVSSNWYSTNNNNKWVNQTDGSRHYGHNVNVGSVNGDYWAITGVQLEVGKNATEFEHRSYGEELALCQRYYYKTPSSHYHFLHKNAYYESQLFYFPTTMRAAPTVTVPTPVLRRIDASSNISYTGLASNRYPDGFYLTSTTTNNNLFYTWIMIGHITADAEL